MQGVLFLAFLQSIFLFSWQISFIAHPPQEQPQEHDFLPFFLLYIPRATIEMNIAATIIKIVTVGQFIKASPICFYWVEPPNKPVLPV